MFCSGWVRVIHMCFLFRMSLIFLSCVRFLSPPLTVFWSFLPGSLTCQKASSGSTLHFCPKCPWPFSSTVRPKPKTSWRNFSMRTGERAKLKVACKDERSQVGRCTPAAVASEQCSCCFGLMRLCICRVWRCPQRPWWVPWGWSYRQLWAV